MDDYKEARIIPTNDVEGIFKTRYIQGLMMFFMFFIAISFRWNSSVAIIPMTSSSPDLQEQYWSVRTVGWVLSSFFWGYLVILFPAGQLGQLFSVKKLLLAANLCCAVLALLTPAAAIHGGWIFLWLIRLIQGLSQGLYLPLSYNLTSKWIPLNERCRFVGFFLNGGTLGATVSLVVSGLITSSTVAWPSVFYMLGTLGLVWSAVWWWVGADSPLTHPTIHPGEQLYIQAALNTTQSQTLPTPWKSIITSAPLWAIIGASIGNAWGYTTLNNQLPAYIKSVLGYDIQKNVLLSALPYLSLWIFSFPVCWFADYLDNQKVISTVNIRKLSTSLCMVGNALVVMCLPFAGTNAVAATTLTTFGVTISAFKFSGFNLNHLDLSPHYAGVLMGLSTGLENFFNLGTRTVAWELVADMRSVAQWQQVFTLSAHVTLVGYAVYMIWGSADVQPWDSPPTTNSTSLANLRETKETVISNSTQTC